MIKIVNKRLKVLRDILQKRNLTVAKNKVNSTIHFKKKRFYKEDKKMEEMEKEKTEESAIGEDKLFIKFSSVENTYRKDFHDALTNGGFTEGEFVALEKIHGANFSLSTDGKIVQANKRNSALKEGMNFHFWKTQLETHKEKVLNIWKLVNENVLKEEEEDPRTVIVFGEIFGGHYPHNQVTRLKVPPVQKEVCYCPEIRFIAYDIWCEKRGYLVCCSNLLV